MQVLSIDRSVALFFKPSIDVYVKDYVVHVRPTYFTQPFLLLELSDACLEFSLTRAIG